MLLCLYYKEEEEEEEEEEDYKPPWHNINSSYQECVVILPQSMVGTRFESWPWHQ
jgi:hypothetical protein